jgi:sulfonate transport system permease protein
VLIGFAIGSAIGLALGAVVGLSRLGDALLALTLGGVRAVPSLAWVPLLILWMGIGEDSKITLIAIGAFFPVYTTVASALRHVDRHLVEVGRAYGLRGVRLFSAVQLPAVLPSVVSGLRLALAQSWLFLVAAELIASSMGLGFLLMDSGNNGRVDRIILAIILLALLGKLTDSLIGLAEKYLLKRWA